MTRTPVTSSSIKSIGHDPAREVLEVEFASGKVYQYHHVSAGTHAALMAADSIGQHHNAHVRGKFPHSLVEEEPK